MQEILLVNPRRRRKAASKKRRARRGRSAAQKRATAKLLAFNRARRGGSASPKRRRRRARSKARRSTAVSLGGLPIMKRRRRSARAVSRRRRRNPSSRGSLSLRSVARQPAKFLMPALIGAVGAIGVNTAMSRLMPMLLPANLQSTFMTGRVRYLTQAAAAIGLGMAAQKLGMRRGMAEKMAEGSLTVTFTDMLRDFAMSAGISLGGMGYYLPGRQAGRAVPSASGVPGMTMNGLNGRMGAYVTGPGSVPGNVTPMRRMAGMGFGPGRTF